MEKAIIVDLDGTLADITHRVHHVQSTKKNWKAFYEAIPHDVPNGWCIELILAMKGRGYQILFLTGRDDLHMEKSREWLSRHAIPFDRLYMRKVGDHRQDDVVKSEIYQREIKNQYEILFVVEDRLKVVEMWRRIGLTCLQCEWGDF